MWCEAAGMKLSRKEHKHISFGLETSKAPNSCFSASKSGINPLTFFSFPPPPPGLLAAAPVPQPARPHPVLRGPPVPLASSSSASLHRWRRPRRPPRPPRKGLPLSLPPLRPGGAGGPQGLQAGAGMSVCLNIMESFYQFNCPYFMGGYLCWAITHVAWIFGIRKFVVVYLLRFSGSQA